MPNDPLLRPAEVARLLAISRSQTYDLLAGGEITVVRIGRLVRVDPADLADYLARNKRSSSPVLTWAREPRAGPR